jgi:hypothetical protein
MIVPAPLLPTATEAIPEGMSRENRDAPSPGGLPGRLRFRGKNWMPDEDSNLD